MFLSYSSFPIDMAFGPIPHPNKEIDDDHCDDHHCHIFSPCNRLMLPPLIHRSNNEVQ